MNIPLPPPFHQPSWYIPLAVVALLLIWHFLDGIIAILSLIREAAKWLIGLIRKKRP
jgi:hypothetical protein